MKKIVLIALMAVSVSVVGIAQDRVNTVLPIVSEPISVLNNAMGWKYNFSTEQWKSEENKISQFDDFIKMEFRSIQYKEKKYIGLFIFYTDGSYKYPSLQIDYSTYTAIHYFLFDENEYTTKISQLSDSIGTIEIKALAYMPLIVFNNDQIPKELAKVINEVNNKQIDWTYTFYLQHRNLESKNLIQFLIYYKDCYRLDSSKKENTCYINTRKVRMISDYTDKYSKHLGKDSIFDFFYFETKLDNFIKVFSLTE